MSKKYIKLKENDIETVRKIEKNDKKSQVFDENKRFFVPDAKPGNIKIEGEEHNHLANVMRYKVGDDIILICNDDYDYLGKIIEIAKNYTIVNIDKKVPNKSNPSINVTAFVAVNKREPMSLMVRMLSELGVSTFVPFTTKWTQSQDANEKIDRFQKIADQSAKQCRRSKTLKISQAKKLNEICNMFKQFDVAFFAYEKEDKLSMQDYFVKNKKEYKNIAFIVGPVAGFDVDEAKMIVDSGAISISLGKRILKEDTACVAMGSILMDSLNYWLL